MGNCQNAEDGTAPIPVSPAVPDVEKPGRPVSGRNFGGVALNDENNVDDKELKKKVSGLLQQFQTEVEETKQTVTYCY